MSVVSTAKSDEAARKLAKIQVMVVDTSDQVTTLFSNMLTKLGFTNVLVANDGFEALQVLQTVKINLVIVDWELKIPGTENEEDKGSAENIIPFTGVDFVRKLRLMTNSLNSFAPVIIMSDSPGMEQVIAARDAGVNEICVKPLTAEDLCSRIVSVIDRPRIFVTSKTYRGPCRRRKVVPLPPGMEDRRKVEIRVIKRK